MKITIGYITAREEPRLDWLIDGLDKQAERDDKIDLVVVDAFARPASAIGYRPIRAIRKLVETPPKPTIWQGPHRVTAHNFFANANARNTAIALCGTDYICFLDDRCKLDAGWLAQVRRGERKRNAVICGPYDKREDRGLVIDHRRQQEPRGKKNCGGGWLFGGNLALPLAWALEVNGFEEGCDPVGLEDCVFGHMLERAGHRVDFVAEMSVHQDRRGLVHPLHFPRQDKGTSPEDKSHALRDRFYPRKRTEFTPDLRKLRVELAHGRRFPIPDPAGDHRDWYDGSPIKAACMSSDLRLRAAAGASVHAETSAPQSRVQAAGPAPQSEPLTLAVAMTTAPRREVTLARSLASLRAAGFEEDVHLFVEPGTLATLGSLDLTALDDGRTILHENAHTRGCFDNWRGALTWLVMNTRASWLLVLQDDTIWQQDAAATLRAQMRDRHDLRTGFLSPYTSPMVVGEGFVDGWNECRVGQDFWGALAFCLRRSCAEELLRHPRFAGYTDSRQVDGVVAASMLDLDRPSFVHVPSLVDHIGFTSTIGRDGESATGRRGYRFRAS